MHANPYHMNPDRPTGVPDIRRHPVALRERLSRRVVSLPADVRRRYELARIRVERTDAALVRTLWQLVSISTPETSARPVDDPAFVDALEGVRVRWDLEWHHDNQDRNLDPFPFDEDLPGRPLDDQPEGWIDAPLMYGWGSSAQVRIRVASGASLRLFATVEQTDGALTAIGGLLAGESRLAQDTPEFWQWWGRR